jgi:hypothetical protein
MHGIIFAELQKFVSTHQGSHAWNELLRRTGLRGSVYVSSDPHPDSDFESLVAAASQLTGRPTAQILEDFGDFITPVLINRYGHLLSPRWTSLDVIEHTENTVHTLVRARHPGAHPPRLKTKRTGPNEIVLTYTSPRRLCFLAIGIGRGLGRHFKENLSIEQERCMYEGDSLCEITYRKID